MMQIDNAFGGMPLEFRLRATGMKTFLEITPRKWENYELMLSILSVIGFSVETKGGLTTVIYIDPLPECYNFAFGAGCIGVLELWHDNTYLKVTDEGDLRITGKEEIMQKVANLCLHSNPDLACSVQNGV